MRSISKPAYYGDLGTAFFCLTTFAVGVVFALHQMVTLSPAVARAEEGPTGYRLTITAKRLPVECREAGGNMYRIRYCDQFYDAGVVERMQAPAP